MSDSTKGVVALVAKWRKEADDFLNTCGPEDRGYNNALYQLADELEAWHLAQPAGEAVAWPNGEFRLWDSQWVNIVNHERCYADMDKDEAVALAVKLTEKAMRENIERATTHTAPPVAGSEARGAARYRWLRDKCNVSIGLGWQVQFSAAVNTPEGFDAAIDAAIAGTPPKGDAP